MIGRLVSVVLECDSRHAAPCGVAQLNSDYVLSAMQVDNFWIHCPLREDFCWGVRCFVRR